MAPQGYNTYIGLIVAIAPAILAMFNITPTPAFNEQFPAFAMAIIQIAGLGYAAWGRARAETPGWFSKKK